MVCDPVEPGAKLYVEVPPLLNVGAGVTAVPSTSTVKVPGFVDETGDTVIVITSVLPTAGEKDAGESVVVEAALDEDEEAGQAPSKFEKSIEPKPEASSYPVPAEYWPAAWVEQRLDPAVHLLFPLIMS